jgi:hypothetical protein
MRTRILAPLAVGLAFACACGSGGSGSSSGDATPPAPTGSPTPPPAPTDAPPPAPHDECALGTAVCTAKDRAKTCKQTADGARWSEVTCAAGSGCLLGVCTVGACSDECTLGEVQAGKACGPWAVASGAAASASDPVTSMHDRSRAYLGWMAKGPMVAGSIGSPRYADPGTFSQITAMNGLGDSAIWTGTYLAAEALRLLATGSSDARARVRDLVDRIHLLMNVSGEPGMLARWAKPSSKTYPFTVGDLDCGGTDKRSHCNIPYAGTNYDYVGHISRDQYQGVMLGYALAYEALGPSDDDARELIRKDVVAFVEELMKERTVPVKVIYQGVPITLPALKLRFVVLDPREMEDGSIVFPIDGSADKSADMWGFQEFTPNLADLVRQLPGLSFSPDIFRESSAIMLASFFRVAMEVSDGVPAYQARHDAITAYYVGHTGAGGNVSDWLDVAMHYAFSTSCGNAYYGNNITWEPMYNLAHLEDAAAYATRVKKDLLADKLWPPFATQKNSFFSFIYAANVPGGDAAAATSAATQLAGFPAPPRVVRAVDLTSSAKYPSQEPGCTNQDVHTDAVDVADRPTEDFLWQRHPWSLYAAADPAQVEPGVDYLVAYWLGRRHALLTDDTPGVCLAWQ